MRAGMGAFGKTYACPGAGLGGQWGHAPRCLSTSVRSEVPEAERLQAANDLVILCMQSQRVCGRESVAVHGGHSACARRVSGFRRV